MTITPMPDDWTRAVVFVAHPDDPEYGMAAAVASWTARGKDVRYVLASSGEAGIEGMPADDAGPLREEEERNSAAVVGVSVVEFLGLPDSRLENDPLTRGKVANAILEHEPDLVVSGYSGPEWAPGMPNQRDHTEFAAAVFAAYDDLDAAGRLRPGTRLFENSPFPTHAVDVTGHVDQAVLSLAEQKVYMEVLDPATPVIEQARAQTERVTRPIEGFGDVPAVGFERVRPRES